MKPFSYPFLFAPTPYSNFKKEKRKKPKNKKREKL